MRKFKVNDFITLILDNNETVIYVNNERFNQCKFLLLNIPIEKISSFDEIESVDEAAEKLDKSLEPFEGRVDKIPPEVEFWGHCSNLQVWYEHNYDTRLLHRNLAFPLLKKLSEVGDALAIRVFKEELIKRISEGNTKVLAYLINEQYFKSFEENELEILLLDSTINLLIKIAEIFDDKEIEISDNVMEFVIDILIYIKSDMNLLKNLIIEPKIDFIKSILLIEKSCGHVHYIKEQIIEIFNELKNFQKSLRGILIKLFILDSDIILFELISLELHEYLNKDDFLKLFTNSKSKLKENLIKLVKNKAGKYQTNKGYLYEQIITFLVILCKNIGKMHVFQFLNKMEKNIKILLQKGMRDQLKYLKHENSQYYLNKQELENYVLEFLEILKKNNF